MSQNRVRVGRASAGPVLGSRHLGIVSSALDTARRALVWRAISVAPWSRAWQTCRVHMNNKFFLGISRKHSLNVSPAADVYCLRVNAC